MRLLVDAQLPDRLAGCLTSLGHDVVHTSELANGNRTTDAEIIRIADRDDRTVVTKDHDFLDGHLLNNAPRRLLLVTTGNIRNNDLIPLWNRHSDHGLPSHNAQRISPAPASRYVPFRDTPDVA